MVELNQPLDCVCGKPVRKIEETLNLAAFISDGIRPRKLPTYCKL
jgi:hypothetical protein